MAKELYNTPNLDELENGPWPCVEFTGIFKFKFTIFIFKFVKAWNHTTAIHTGTVACAGFF
jgi:hypothetical protein